MTSTWSCCLKCLNLVSGAAWWVFGCPSVSSSDKDQNNPSTQVNNINQRFQVPRFNIMFIWSVSEELQPFQSDLPPCLLCNSYIFSPSRTWATCVCESMRLLVGTLYPRPVVATLLVGAVVVGLSAATRRRALADVIVLQVDLLRVSSDDGWLWSRGQHVLQLLQVGNISSYCKAALTHSLIMLWGHGCRRNSAAIEEQTQTLFRGQHLQVE